MMNKFLRTIVAVVLAGSLAACSQPSPTNQTTTATAANNAQSSPKSAETAVKTTNVAPPKEAPHWDYEAEGPAKWSALSKDWAICGEGKAQSPIDIEKTSASKLPEITTQFPPAELKIVHHEHHADAINNGHTIQVNYSEGDTLTIGGEKYALKQYHFHGPSEHTIKGKHSPMEMHMVHQSADKKLAVVGVLINEGKTNNAFEPVWANLPKTKSAETHFANVKVDVNQLLPNSRTTYRYDGSLTTPPCSENVKWIVFSNPIEMSTTQIGKFKELIKTNNRPTQPINGRTIATEGIDEKVSN